MEPVSEKVLGLAVPLTALDPSFVKFSAKPGVLKCHDDATIAQGVWFLCPKCVGSKAQHGHTVLFTGRGVPEKAQPEGRWDMSGNDYASLTLRQGIGSVACTWEGYILNGKVLTQ